MPPMIRALSAAAGMALLAAALPPIAVAAPSAPAELAVPVAAGPKADAKSRCIRKALRKVRKGPRAVKELGRKLPDAAASAGMPVKRYARMLRSDRRFRVDRCGKAFVVEDAIPVAKRATLRKSAKRAPAGPPAAAALSTTGDAFSLSSRPGAARTIYLDFDGATVSGTAWNTSYNGGASFSAPPMNADSDPAFNASELAIVKDVWLRVAEDYAPFNVNVTTAVPPASALIRSDSSDQVYGATALITNDSLIYGKCSCGGVAYVGVYSYTGSTQRYQPAFVFQRGLGVNGKSLAEAASHEVGHNLGLSHDGTVANGSTAAQGYYRGQGPWAPIMGVGYSAPVTQWSKGEYQYASSTQDDLAIMVSNGAPLMADDHGAAAASATPLVPGTAADGLVSTRTDEDWFSFTGSGSTTVTVTPQATSPNLDVLLRIRSADGTTLATVDPAVTKVSSSTATGLNAAHSFSAPTGTYYAVVDGTGYGNPLNTGYSDYGSLGRYTITVTTGSPPASPVQATTTSLASGTVGTAYSASLSATGGTAPYTWTIASGALPAGLTLAASGAISGTPTAAGTSSVAFRVTDTAGGSATTPTMAVTIAAQVVPVAVTTNNLPAATVAKTYSANLAANGGSAPYTWSGASGPLPPGLSLSAGGAITGTPTTAGSYALVFRARDSLGATATSGQITLTVVPAVTPLSVKTTALPNGYRYWSYRTTLAATGGSGGNSWSLAAGSLPSGLTLSSSGVVSGTPTKRTTAYFTVRVRDSAGSTATRALRIKIY